jgi:nitrate reductase NapE component
MWQIIFDRNLDTAGDAPSIGTHVPFEAQKATSRPPKSFRRKYLISLINMLFVSLVLFSVTSVNGLNGKYGITIELYIIHLVPRIL